MQTKSICGSALTFVATSGRSWNFLTECLSQKNGHVSITLYPYSVATEISFEPNFVT